MHVCILVQRIGTSLLLYYINWIIVFVSEQKKKIWNDNKILDKSTIEIVKLFSEADKEPQKAVNFAIPHIVKAIDEITLKLKSNGRLFYIGSGTSGRLGVLDASEWPPTFCTSS